MHLGSSNNGAPERTDVSAAEVASGYLSRSYADAFKNIGRVEPFGMTGGHVLLRSIPSSDRKDISGPYPIFTCTNWSAVEEALNEPLENAVTLTLVTDPFCPLSEVEISQLFDFHRPFHDHWLIDLGSPIAPSPHHRRNLRQAGRFRIESGPADPTFATSFVKLYGHLAEKKKISDLRAFSSESLAAQLAVPGAWLVTSWDQEELLGADLYYLEGRIVRAHLSAYAPKGYANSISYPMMLAAIEQFRIFADIIDLGGAPAVEGNSKCGGVGHFKRGWTQLTRPSYLCGKVFDREAYKALSKGRHMRWFPAYREGEYSGS